MNRVAIIGTGVIGTGWASRFLANGYAVNAWDPASGFESVLEQKLESLWPTLERYGAVQGASLANLHCCVNIADACTGVMHVQESAPERLDIKRDLIARLDALVDPDITVASSSSGLLPSEIQAGMNGANRIIVGHPFNPVYLLPLVEVVPGAATASATVDRLQALYRDVNMHPLLVRKEIEGYLSDRLQEAMWREILHLVNDDVATTGELDDAIVYGPGLRWAIMGTCLTFHLAGGDQGMRHMLEQFGPALKLPWTRLEAPELSESLIDKMVSGTAAQAGDRSVAELEKLRDDCLIEIQNALAKFQTDTATLLPPKTTPR